MIMWDADDIEMWFKYGEEVFTSRRRILFTFSHFEEDENGDMIEIYREELQLPATPKRLRRV